MNITLARRLRCLREMCGANWVAADGIWRETQTAAAIRLLIERNRVVAEGAGAASVAAALTGRAGSGKIVCVISGGNIDSSKLVKILNGELP